MKKRHIKKGYIRKKKSINALNSDQTTQNQLI